MTEIIGRGEVACVKLLKKHFGQDTVIKTQVKLGTLLNYDWQKDMSERQKKETLDIVVMRKNGRPLVIRVQDKHHATRRFNHIDKAQEFALIENGCDVIDIWYYECPHIFNDEDGDEAYIELLQCFQERLTYTSNYR